MKTLVAGFAALGFLLAAASPSMACERHHKGFLAGLVAPVIGCQAADNLDAKNAQARHPVERIIETFIAGQVS